PRFAALRERFASPTAVFVYEAERPGGDGHWLWVRGADAFDGGAFPPAAPHSVWAVYGRPLVRAPGAAAHLPRLTPRRRCSAGAPRAVRGVRQLPARSWRVPEPFPRPAGVYSRPRAPRRPLPFFLDIPVGGEQASGRQRHRLFALRADGDDPCGGRPMPRTL